MILYFSGTGNTRLLAHQLGDLLHDEVIDITSSPQDTSIKLTSSSSLGLLFPVYAWGVPPIVEACLKRWVNDFKTTPNYCYAICTCGDSIGFTDSLLRKLFAQIKLPLHAFASVIMPETYIALPGFKLDSKPLAKQKLDKAQQTIAHYAESIAKKEKFNYVIRGYFPRITSYLIRPFFNRFLVKDHYFTVNDHCIHCNKCVESCPIENISLDHQKKPKWNKHCTGCLACYHHCPQQAINYLYTKGKGQYTFGV